MKITNENIQIAKDVLNGASLESLAEKRGVTTSRIREICRGASWRALRFKGVDIDNNLMSTLKKIKSEALSALDEYRDHDHMPARASELFKWQDIEPTREGLLKWVSDGNRLEDIHGIGETTIKAICQHFDIEYKIEGVNSFSDSYINKCIKALEKSGYSVTKIIDK